nr:CHAD domain-containing protein [Helicobacteraceae bacterium]
MQTDTLVTYLIYQLETAQQLLSNLAVTNDPEEIHRFRVALRRSRSLLNLYEPDYYAIEKIIKSIFKPTNTLRELDVLLLSIDKVDYPTLYKDLQLHRDEHYNGVLTAAYIARSSSLLKQVTDELQKMNSVHSDQILIKKAHRYAEKTDRAYKRINPGTKPKELHRVRIGYKRVRYSLEFLKESGLEYKKGKLKHAQQRQEQLGAIQDARNQLHILHSGCKTGSLAECEAL